MKTYLFWLVVLLFSARSLPAAPPSTSPFIKVDQFGYFPSSEKVAVISNPKVGFNANQSFSPGTGTNRYQVRRWNDDAVVFQGTLVSWKNGETHAQSGDQGWWFDFSGVTEPGSYYVYDAKNNVGSGRFEIGETVYDQVLEQAVRMFYYQRINYPKQAPYAGEWTDGASFEGPNQDRAARSANDRNNSQRARDLHGGWYDAGDLNKYTTFTFDPITQMLEAYRENPGVFNDDYNIPESGNGVADLLDEVKYELDWLTRMQDATGTNGLLLKVGTIGFGGGFPPSQNSEPRYYVGECTSATITGAAVFALGGLVYQSLPSSALKDYGRDLVARAERAWERARVTTQDYTVFETDCDVAGDNGLPIVRAGDADRNEQRQKNSLATAAVYLYEATGQPQYRTYVENQYRQTSTIGSGLSWPYSTGHALALLRYTTLPDVSSEVAQAIISEKINRTPPHSVADYRAETDLYRAFMEDRAYHWGSNAVRSNSGNVLLDFNTFGINDDDRKLYQTAAEQYAHWLHGVNPLGRVMLSNMYDYGAERSANEISHAWFADGTQYDNAQAGVGPAPGYLVGGPDKNYGIDYGSTSLSPPYGQPAQKSYLDSNNGAAIYAVSEPSIVYQGPYVALLSRLIGAQKTRTTPPPPAAEVADRYVYQDGLAEGWQNWSWSSDIDLAQSAVVQEGSRAMKVTFQAAGGGAGVSLRSEGAINANDYQAIQLAVRGGEQADQVLRVYVQTEDVAGGSTAKSIVAPAGRWQEVTVLLSELGNPGIIKRITLENGAAGTFTPFYVDNLRLVSKAAEPGTTVAIEQSDVSQTQAYPNELGEGDALQLVRRGKSADGPQWVEIVDAQGKVVYQAIHQEAQSQIDRGHFRHSGIYIVRVRSLRGESTPQTEVFRVVVQ